MDESNPWLISSKQFSHYYSFYHELVPEGTLLGGSRAREFFLLSNLPTEALHLIWNMSDYDEDGQLNAAEFAVALHLAQISLKHDMPIPPTLPEELRLLLQQATRPHLPMAKPTQLLKCSSAFMHFCENLAGQGYLKEDAAKYLLTNSQISVGHLFHIWKLSDADRDGRLSFEEFVVAMHLIFIVKLGIVLPLSVNTNTIFPHEFSQLVEQVRKDVAELPVVHNPPRVPVVPPFVILRDRDNPFISPVFRAIPPDHFRTGKFDGFIDNPFPLPNHHISEDGLGRHGRLASSSLEELSAANSSRCSSQNSYLDNNDACKPSSSSHHSSVRSLVEEHDEPTLQQAESIELMHSARSDEEEEGMEDEEKVVKELDQISEANQQLMTSMGGPLPPKPQEKPEPFALDPNMKHAAIQGLGEVIKQVSPGPTTNGVTSIDRQKPKEAEPKPPLSKHGDILAQLDNLEAEIMNVIDDTTSFNPSIAAPMGTPATITEKPPPVPKKTTSSQLKPREDVDFQSFRRHHSASSVGSFSLPQKLSKEESSGKIPDSPTKSSSSSSTTSSPSHRSSFSHTSPRRKRSDSSIKRRSQALGDLDSLLGDELASINSMMEEFHTQDKEAQQRKQKEEQELQKMESKAKEGVKLHIPQVTSMEEIKRKRMEESAQKQKEWEDELRAIEEQARQQYNQQTLEKMQLLNDESVQDLEQEWQALLEHEEEAMKDARIIRAQKDKEDQERMERMKKEMAEKKEVTIEEWIAMMEEKKVQEMTPEEKKRYEQRKQEWLQRRHQKEEQRKKEEEEKIIRSRARMIAEYRSIKKMEEEVKGARQSALETMQRKMSLEHQRKEAEERKARSEESRKKREEEVRKEIEEARSKAKSAIAARFEEQVKSRTAKGSNNNNSTTVLASPIRKPSIESREEERLAKRLGKLS